MKLRLAIDPSDRPLALETEGTLWLAKTPPRFEGTFTLSRPAGLVLPDGKTLVNVPWRASGRIKGTSAAALIEQLEVQYGPEERALKLTGTADLQLGSRPRFAGVLSARQIDIDRSLLVDRCDAASAGGDAAGARRYADRDGAAAAAGQARHQHRQPRLRRRAAAVGARRRADRRRDA